MAMPIIGIFVGYYFMKSILLFFGSLSPRTINKHNTPIGGKTLNHVVGIFTQVMVSLRAHPESLLRLLVLGDVHEICDDGLFAFV